MQKIGTTTGEDQSCVRDKKGKRDEDRVCE